MLRFMRRHRRSFVVKGVFVVLILVFIGWGVGSFEAARRTAAVAVVNGVDILAGDLAQTHQNLIRAYQELYGSAYSPELALQLDLEGRALDELITSALLITEARRLGLRVTDEEVADSIRSMAVFSPGGQFDKNTYLRYLRFAQITEDQFVDQQRKALLVQKVENLITDGARVSEGELRDRYIVENQQVNLRFVKLPWRELRETETLTEEDLRAYYEQNPDRYRDPERITFTFVAYRPKDFASDASVGEDEVTRFYEERVAERFTDPPQVQLRQLVLNIPPEASEEDRAAIRGRADDLAAKASQGDFAALVREYSEHEASAKKGGDLGWVSRQKLPPEIADAAFALEKGQTSAPVTLPTAVYIMKAEDKRGARPRPLDEVRTEIEASLRDQKGRTLARRAADEDATSIARGATLEEIAAARGLTPGQSAPLATTDIDPALGPAEPLVTAAQRLEVGETSDVVETPSGLFMVRPSAKQPAAVLPFEEVRTRIEADLGIERAKKAAQEKAEALLPRLQETRDLDALAAEEGLTIQETGSFSRLGQEIVALGLDQQFIDDAFSLSTQQPVAPRVYVTVAGDALLAVLKQRTDPDLTALEQQRDMLRDGYLQRKKQALMATFITQLKQQATIEVRADLLPQT